MAITISSLHRIIAHRIITKTSTTDAYAICSDGLLQMAHDTVEQRILNDRINKAINNPSKSFELTFDRNDADSVHALLTNYERTDESFISMSRNLAERLADAHTSSSIPNGICIVCDGTLSTRDRFICIIKADYQEVFNIHDNTLSVISEVFLSPAREFYKIGLFVFHRDIIRPYMYDDQFSAVKTDLTRYFYSDFLGLKTSENDILQTKAFYQDTNKFIERRSVKMDPVDVAGLKNALNVYYRENVSHIVSANDFLNNHLAGTSLAADFSDEIITKYPRAFTLKPSLLDRKLKLQRVGLGADVTLFIRPTIHVTANILDPTQESLQPYINSGRNYRIIVLESEADEG